MTTVKKNILLLFFVQVSNYIFPLLTLPYIARVLGAQHFGYLALAQAVIQYCILVSDYGFNLSATRRITIATSIQERSRIFFATFYAKSIMVFLIFILLLFGTFLYESNIKYVVMVLYLSVVGNLFFPLYLYQALNKMKNIVWISVLAKLASLFSVFLLVQNSKDIVWAAFSLSLGLIMSGVLSAIYIIRSKIVVYTRVGYFDVWESIKDGFPLFISNIAISFYTTFNTIVVGHYFSAVTLGNYSAAERLRMAVQSMYSPIQQVIFPRVNMLYKNNNYYLRSTIKYGCGLISFGILLMVCSILFGYKSVIIYLGAEYKLSANLFVAMAPLFVIISLSIVLGQWGLIVLGRAKVLSKIYIFCAVIHVCYIIPFIKFFSITGVVYSIILTELLVCFLIFLVLYSIHRGQKNVTL